MERRRSGSTRPLSALPILRHAGAGTLAPAQPPRTSRTDVGAGQNEKIDYFEKWLNQDVAYIITPQEKTVFRSLNTDLERERFIERFWRRRAPDPGTSVCEYQEEHYWRIAYANQ